jgi:hypothetical protein
MLTVGGLNMAQNIEKEALIHELIKQGIYKAENGKHLYELSEEELAKLSSQINNQR